MNRVSKVLAAALLTLSAFGVTKGALADDRANADTAKPEQRRVLLIVAGSAEDAAALDASLRELLTRIGAVLDVRRVERLELDNPASLEQQPERSGVAVVWVDLQTSNGPALAIADGRTQRVVLSRRMDRRGSSAMEIEAIAHVVQSAVEELAQTPTPPSPPKEPPPVIQIIPPETPPRDAVLPVESPRTGWGIDLGGFFGGRSFGGGSNLVVGGGGTAALSTRRGQWRPAVMLMGEYHVAFDVPGDLVSVHAQVLSLRLLPTFQIAGGASWLIEAGLGGGTDLFFTSARSTDLPAASLKDSRTDAAPVLTAIVAAHVAVARSADLVLALSLDGDLAPRHFVADAAGTHEAIFAPQRFRPALMVGFTFAALGPVPYPTTGSGR